MFICVSLNRSPPTCVSIEKKEIWGWIDRFGIIWIDFFIICLFIDSFCTRSVPSFPHFVPFHVSTMNLLPPFSLFLQQRALFTFYFFVASSFSPFLLFLLWVEFNAHLQLPLANVDWGGFLKHSTCFQFLNLLILNSRNQSSALLTVITGGLDCPIILWIWQNGARRDSFF